MIALFILLFQIFYWMWTGLYNDTFNEKV